MKNQYFADRNDFFKYDLALYLIERIPILLRFTFVPMLTPNDDGGDGNLTSYSVLGQRRPDLHAFLMECLVDDSRRQVGSLAEYLATRHAIVDYYLHHENEHFDPRFREGYFGSIPACALDSAVILLDPDNGLAVPSMIAAKRHKYLQFDDLSKLASDMSPTSVLLVYQHWPRMSRETAFAAICARIRDNLPTAGEIACLSSGTVGFYALTKHSDMASSVIKAMDRYAHEQGFKLFKESSCG
ncbi:MAG: hypothetical protein LLG08_05460 [Actinomycetia bacterium]|nr:hypothetical protein [Actinomycetes bacterium]